MGEQMIVDFILFFIFSKHSKVNIHFFCRGGKKGFKIKDFFKRSLKFSIKLNAYLE